MLARQEGAPSLPGFSSKAAQAEEQWEQKFRAIPSTDNLRESMKLLSAHPHHVGSPYDKQDADWLAAKFKEWGWDVHVETFQVLFPTPTERVVELVEPTQFPGEAGRAAASHFPRHLRVCLQEQGRTASP